MLHVSNATLAAGSKGKSNVTIVTGSWYDVKDNLSTYDSYIDTFNDIKTSDIDFVKSIAVQGEFPNFKGGFVSTSNLIFSFLPL